MLKLEIEQLKVLFKRSRVTKKIQLNIKMARTCIEINYKNLNRKQPNGKATTERTSLKTAGLCYEKCRDGKTCRKIETDGKKNRWRVIYLEGWC